MGVRRDALRRAREEFNRVNRPRLPSWTPPNPPKPPKPQPKFVEPPQPVEPPEPVELPTFHDAVRAARYHYLVQVLTIAEGNARVAAKIAGMNRTYFYAWLHKLSIQPNDYRPKGSPAANRAHRGNWGD
jgi:DNA-binding NtrC family response regulator